MYTPKKIKEKIIAFDKYRKILRKYFLEENWEVSEFFIYAHNNKQSIWTFVLPITENWEIIYTKEYRAWPEEIVTWIPVWALEDNVSEIENCKNELEEEAWYTSDEYHFLWESIIEWNFEWKAKYYLAKNCKPLEKQNLDIWENITVHKTTIKNFREMILTWEINFPKVAYCFFLAWEKWYLDEFK